MLKEGLYIDWNEYLKKYIFVKKELSVLKASITRMV